MTTTKTTVWVTKWALTKGILEWATQGDVSDTTVYARGVMPNWSVRGEYLRKGEWHLTRDFAVMLAHRMRVKRITSLKTQLAKLKAMTFKVEEWHGTQDATNT